MASENFPVAPRDFFPERKVVVCTGKNIPGKTEHFSTSLLQVKMEKKMEKKKKEPVSYDEVFLYLSDKKYSCSDDLRKRPIRSKRVSVTGPLCVKGELRSKMFFLFYSQASPGKIFWQKTDGDTITGSCFFRRNVLQVGGRSPPFLMSSFQ